MSFFALGVNHQTASVELREQIAFNPERLNALFAEQSQHPVLNDILQRTNIESLIPAPEMADKLAKEYALGLQEKYLKQKLKSPISLIESRNLRQQLNELTKKISLRLLHS